MSPVRNPDAPSSSFSMDDAPSSVVVEKPRPKRLGFYVPLTPDGTLDTSRVRDTATLEKLRSTLGVTIQPPEEKQRPVINRAFIPHAYSLLEVGIQRAGKLFLKWPPGLVEEMHFDPAKKEALTEPTAAVLEKYAPTWLIDNQEIAALAAALTDAINDMVQGAVERFVAKEELKARPVTQPINGGEARPV